MERLLNILGCVIMILLYVGIGLSITSLLHCVIYHDFTTIILCIASLSSLILSYLIAIILDIIY